MSSLWHYGPAHQWFAWFPVFTPVGWKWLRKVTRQRVYVGLLVAAAEWWEYR